MKAHMDIFSGTRTRLTRHDLITFETLLAEAVGRFLSFKSYSLYFPRVRQEHEPIWDQQDKRLLLPLVLNGQLLAVFVARGVSMRAPKTMLPLLTGMGTLVLEKLMLYKMSITDPATGLYSRPYMQRVLCREIDLIRECFHPSGDGGCELSAMGHRACLGVITFRLQSLHGIVRDFGYLFADRVANVLADKLREIAPQQALAARTGDTEFALFLPSGTPKSCRKLAKDAVLALRSVRVTHELTDDQVGVTLSAGYANYPQDMEGAFFEKAVQEQARLLLRKSRIAAGIAGEKSVGDTLDHVMGYNRILVEGGKVEKTLPMQRVMVNLGHSMGAREGQRFSVWAVEYDSRKNNGGDENGNGETPPPMFKGEVVLMDVRETTSQAEIMHLGDPTWPIAAGDRVTLLPEEKGVSASGEGEAGNPDPLTGLLRHRDFLARFARERDRIDAFALSIIRLTGEDKNRDSKHAHPEQLMAEAAEMCRDMLGPDAIGGRYGLNSLFFYHAGVSPEDIKTLYEELTAELYAKLHIEAAAGIYCHPFLRYRKADSLENCLKALDYAMLLPAPRVGLMDTLALNISADKMYSKGDIFDAIEEYKRALLADENNTMAWNSLGVCYAGLGKPHEARKHFEEALGRDKKDVMALYNLGHICHSLGEIKQAREYYKKCLKQDKQHVYALIRLGQLAEGDRKFGIARQYYNRAANLQDNQALVQRHLARLCMKQSRPDEAREHLHQALLHNPQDAIALHLMARLYLDGGDDPEIAEVLARQSVALRPDQKAGWIELARAFEALGKHADAREALIKAGEL